MKAPALDTELRNALKKLRLGALWDVLPERLVLAEKQSMPYQDLLLLLLQDEISRRESTSARR